MLCPQKLLRLPCLRTTLISFLSLLAKKPQLLFDIAWTCYDFQHEIAFYCLQL